MPKYLDKDNPAALDNVANGSAALPYLTVSYGVTQTTALDDLNIAPTAAPYDLGAGVPLTLTKGLNFKAWATREGVPEINGGDATRLFNISGVAAAILFDGLKLENTRAGLGSYIIQAGAATRNLRARNCVFEGATALGAITVASGGSGVIIEDSCVFNTTGGGVVYNGLTGSFESYANVNLAGTAQAAYFFPTGDSAGATAVIGGTINLVDTTNNYIVRCSVGNTDMSITIDSTFFLESVPSTFTRSVWDIINPRTFTAEDGWRIDTRGTQLLALGDIHIYNNASQGATVNTGVTIGAGTIDRAGIDGYGIKIGDESPSDAHGQNKYAFVDIDGVTLRDGKEFGTAGNTITHDFFIGNEKIYHLTNLHGIQGGYGIGWKGDDVIDVDSYAYNCLMEGMRLAHFKTKGGTGTRWINCHALENGKGGIGFDLTDNTDSGASGLGNATIIRNCIMEMDSDAGVNIDAASNLGDEDIDYNIYIITGTGNPVTVAGVNQDLTEGWKARGNDAHSYIVLDRAEIFDEDDNIIEYSVAWRNGCPVTGVTPVTDITGEDEIVLTNVTLSPETNIMRRRIKAFI